MSSTAANIRRRREDERAGLLESIASLY